MSRTLTVTAPALPAVITREGRKATKRFLEFFTANIRNPNTRLSYMRAIGPFLAWCEERGTSLHQIEPIMVAAYIERLTQERTPQTVKQHLAAIRMLFDWLVTGQVVPFNPAASVRGPRYSIRKGKTPVLSAQDTRKLLDSIDTSHVVGLRDRALIGTMVYSFARVSTIVNMKVRDYYPQGKRYWIRLHETGSSMRCRRTTLRNSTSTSTSRPPASPRRRVSRCFAPQGAGAANSRRTP
jgi:integrase/recombinase XerD